MSVSEPGKIITPWAESGLKNTIPPAANPATGRAGFDQGFSAINMTAKEAGGIPPFGQDFNGIFYEVTNILRYMQAGGQPTFDSALATAIGGYPKGAMVLGSDGVTLWQSKVDSNSTDPNTNPSDWGTFDIGLKADLAAPGGAGLVGGLPAFVTATKYAGGATTSSTSNDAAIIAAINDAIATGSYVYWPAVYEVQGNIPNFHSVRHDGPGGMKRGEDVFRAHLLEWQGNILYVDPAGSDLNDGITSTHPVKTIQKASNAFKGIAKVTAGDKLIIQLSAGTHTNGAVFEYRSAAEIVVSGASKATTIIAGATATTLHGLNFNNCSQVRVRNLQVTGFMSSNASGIIFQNGTRGVIDTCDSHGNSEADFNASEDAEMVFIGACASYGGAKFGARYYRNSGGSLGDGVNPISIDGATQSGLLSRDGSFVVCQDGLSVTNCNNTNTTAGVHAQKGSYIELRTCTVSGNSLGAVAEFDSIIDTQRGTRSFSGNTQDYRIVQGSWDRLGFPLSRDIYAYWAPRSSPSVITAATGYDHVITSTQQTGTQYLSDANLANIDLNKLERISLDATSHRITFVLNANNAYRMLTNQFAPVTDNDKSCGGASNRWSVVHAATGTINTSDAREKTPPKAINDAILDAADDVEIVLFKWLDAITTKGEDAARWHFGVIAQQLRDAFLAHGVDGTKYGLLCYDEWEDEFEAVTEEYEQEAATVKLEGGQPVEALETQILSRETGEMRKVRTAGNRWGVRPDQCMWLMLSASRRRAQRSEKLIAEINERLDKAGL